jgi:predicted Fe-Mo cluster-binding NifX family protein
MKICIPTEHDRGLESRASDHFGTAPFFIFADVDGGGLKTVPNPECHEHRGTCHHIRMLKSHAVDAVACEGIGRQAVAGLTRAGIDVLVPAQGTVAEIVATISAGKARRLSSDEACGGGHHRHRHHRGGIMRSSHRTSTERS